MGVYKIKDTMFQMDITLIFNMTHNQYKAYIKKRYGYICQDEESDGVCLRLYAKGHPVEYVIWIEKFQWLVYEYGLLSHEVMHCVHFVMKDVGITLSDDSVEVFCYYYQRIFAECVAGLSKLTKKQN